MDETICIITGNGIAKTTDGINIFALFEDLPVVNDGQRLMQSCSIPEVDVKESPQFSRSVDDMEMLEYVEKIEAVHRKRAGKQPVGCDAKHSVDGPPRPYTEYNKGQPSGRDSTHPDLFVSFGPSIKYLAGLPSKSSATNNLLRLQLMSSPSGLPDGSPPETMSECQSFGQIFPKKGIKER